MYASELRKSAFEKVPVIATTYREFSEQSVRERKNVPINIVQKMKFTGTFDVNGGKNDGFSTKEGSILARYIHNVGCNSHIKSTLRLEGRKVWN